MIYFIRWWQARQPRERALLTGAVAIIICLLLHVSWQQADDFRTHSQQQLAREQQALQPLAEWESALHPHLVNQFQQSEKPSTDALNALAQQQNLALRLVANQHGWQLKADVALSFPALVEWLTEIDTRWGVEVSQMKMQREKQQVRLTQLELKHAE
jgi:type II secretory pathway component PulM